MPTVTPTDTTNATYVVGSDRYPFAVTRVSKNKKRLWARRLKFWRTDSNGLSENQSYHISYMMEGPEVEFSLRKHGVWVQKGERLTWNCAHLTLGQATAYLDPSF